jgi:hypothetical protein
MNFFEMVIGSIRFGTKRRAIVCMYSHDRYSPPRGLSA